MIVLAYAHPHHVRSRANRALLDAAASVPDVQVRPLYDLYPDFDIDVEAEQAVLTAADAIVLQHPVYWYSVSALAKLWLDTVFVSGWAYGAGGTALAGKRFLWAVTTGGDEGTYAPDGAHRHPFGAFIAPMRQTAHYCGMRWEEPFILHGAHVIDDASLAAQATQYRERLVALANGKGTH
jgi:glutathione-regulated potassium-efflux system ancillary protein KefF